MTLQVPAQSPILIDEDFSDWMDADLQIVDSKGDGAISSIDFDSMWIANDATYLHFRLQLKREINIQSDNELVISIDTDNNSNTGFNVDGIGAEIRYFFGHRFGFLNLPGQSSEIAHHNLGLVSLPTVSGDQFEFSMLRSFEHMGDLFNMGDTLRIVIEDERFQGDRIPNGTASIIYAMTDRSTGMPAFSIDLLDESDLRVMSFNVLNDGLFNIFRRPAFGRILRAVDPHIIGFQEVRDFNSSQTASVVEDLLPSGEDEWHHAKIQPDIVLISKYPIIQAAASDGNGIFKVALPDRTMIMVVAHLPCCENDLERQEEADRLIAFIRNSATNPSTFQIENGTPIIIMGDMNLVGSQRQRQTLIEGDIADQATYGNDYAPDWGAPMSDAKPFATGRPQAVTWFSPFSSFSGGRLDYMLYTASVMQLTNTFALDTESLSDEELNTHRLEANDAAIASDHFALVGDFIFDPTSDTRHPEALKLAISPNPASEMIQVYIPYLHRGPYELRLYAPSGLLIRKWDQDEHSPSAVSVYVGDLPPGLYVCQMIGTGTNAAGSFVVE